MSYYHPEMRGALAAHHNSMAHRLLTDPVVLPADATVGALTYHGGPTLQQPKLVALYAGQFWGDRAKNDHFLKELMEYGYLTAFRGQGTDNGTFVGSYDIPAPTSGVVADADCRAMIGATIGKNGVPQPDANTLYMLILPDGVQSIFQSGDSDASCKAYCAYHSNAPGFYYTVQPANTCSGCNQGVPQDGLQMTEAHELTEACTDPAGSGWYNDQTGEEGSDETAWIALQYGPWTVQGAAAQNAAGQWVNSIGAYVAPVPQPQHFKPSGPTADAWALLQQGSTLAKAELALLLNTDPSGPAAPAWRYLLQGGDVQALLDAWGPYLHSEGAA